MKKLIKAMEWLREQAEDLYVVLQPDGSGWKPPRKDQRNGLHRSRPRNRTRQEVTNEDFE